MKSSFTPQRGKGLVVFYRGGGINGAMRGFPVYVNDVEVAKVTRNGYFTYQAPAGQLRLALRQTGAAQGNDMAANGADALAGAAGAMSAPGANRQSIGIGSEIGSEVGAALRNAEAHRKVNYTTLNVKPGNIYYFEVAFPLSGMSLNARTKQEAEKGIVDCHWQNPS